MARLVLPGADKVGFWLTGLVGVVGSFGGHWLAHLLGLESGEKPSGRIFTTVISIVGAVLLLVLLRMFKN